MVVDKEYVGLLRVHMYYFMYDPKDFLKIDV